MKTQSKTIKSVDVVIIGAGPSGSVCASLLNKAGINLVVIEKQLFPRFSIGESLLPQTMVYLEKAGMLDDIDSADFQFKNGAVFSKNGQYSAFDFSEKSSIGPSTTFQVKRAWFDDLLAKNVIKQGVDIRFSHELVAIDIQDDKSLLTIKDEDDAEYQLSAGFVLDASGFGRVLPRLLDLESPSDFPIRESLFCHIEDNIDYYLDKDEPKKSNADKYNHDRNKILVSVHPSHSDVWYWLIPFSNGESSLGIVAKPEFFSCFKGSNKEKLEYFLGQEPSLALLLSKAKIINEVQQIKGYAANVKSLVGKNYALLGNAGEFLDPVFSSGVTIAVKSADLAAKLIIKQQRGDKVCWQLEFADPLRLGIDTFRVLVDAWYDGRLQDIIFYQEASDDVRRMVCSILAGYAWDENNPYVAKTERRINVLAQICQ